MDPYGSGAWGSGGSGHPQAGPPGGAGPAPGGYGADPATEDDFGYSAEDQTERPGEEEFDVEEEIADDDDEEDEEDEEEDYGDDESDDEGFGGSRGAKRKRPSSSTALESDAALARRMQAEWGRESAGGRRSSRAASHGTYGEGSGDDGGDYSERPAAVPRPTSGGGGIKLKIKLPKPPAPVPVAPAPTTTRGATPSSYAGGGGGSTVALATDDEQYLEWDDDEADEREEAAKKRRRMPHCLLSADELAGMDDEVERVLGHRDIPGAVLNPKDPWSGREFYVKWARYSYAHCSWDAYTTLKQLAGFKRVLNYCRRQDALAAERGALSVEEREEADVRAELEAELEREHSQPERIFAERQVEVMPREPSPPADGEAPAAAPEAQHPTILTQYLVKWRGLPYSEATWESVADLEPLGGGPLIQEFRSREAAAAEPKRTVEAARRAWAASGERAFEAQPEYLQVGTLRDYQLDGLNWMAYSWAKGVNGILADEMGLGKTVQCASMIGYLSQTQDIGGPFLVVVPLSTVPNWAREFKKWIPQVNSIVYVGDAASREVIREFEFPTAGNTPGRPYKFDALITTYELALKDADMLRDIKWSYLMVDEAHRLKNNESALYRELSQWTFKSKLLITGTPLQNNMRELWCLLSFLHPEKFGTAEEFEARHDPKETAGVQRLHSALRPHLLRRVIKDVEKSLPPKNERILRVPMTPLQRQYYRWILSRNFKELNKSAKGSQVTLLNIIMDLKKCCNHPFLFESARENYNAPAGGADTAADRLVVTSGKMVLIDKLLRRLKETGHRVLIFSQMVRVLDILSEYMSARGYRHQRLDGSTPAHQRHLAMERFNAPGSEDFAFLLSTRAGGLGINLATADTVLLFDSDWNPQNDLQAMSRAHRIGQKDIVNIYRLVTSGSVEEDILERAKRKMVLDHVVIQRMDTSGRTVLDPGAAGGAAGARMFGKDELAAILKFGAGELFKEDEVAGAGAPGEGGAAAGGAGASGGGLMTDEDLDAILARAEVVEQREEDAPGGAGDLLSSFNVATFKADEDDAAFWSRLIPEHLRPKEAPVAVEEPGIRAARLRALDGPIGQPVPDFKPKVKKPKAEPGAPIEGAMLRIDRWPQAVDEEGRLTAGDEDPRPHGFPRTLSRKDASAFVRAVKRRGLVSKLPEIAAEGGVATVGLSNPKALSALWHGLLRGCEKAVDLHSRRVLTMQGPGGASGPAGSAAAGGTSGLTPSVSTDTLAASPSGVGGAGPSASAAAPSGAGGGPKAPTDARLDFFGVDVRAGDLLAYVRQMALLETKLGSYAAAPDAARRLRLTVAERPAATAWMRACGWTPDDDSALLVGVYRHGLGAWDKLANDPDLRLRPKLLAAAGLAGATPELPKPSHLDTRSNGLLRQIEKVATRPPKPPKVPAAARGRGIAVGPGMVLRKEPSAAAVAQFRAVAARCEASLGHEAHTLVRKLRTLQRRGSDMDPSLVVAKTRKYLQRVGARIESVAKIPEEAAELWAYVSEFTESALSGEKLAGVYRQLLEVGQGKGMQYLDAQAQQGAQQSFGGVKEESVAGTGAPGGVGIPFDARHLDVVSPVKEEGLGLEAPGAAAAAWQPQPPAPHPPQW